MDSQGSKNSDIISNLPENISEEILTRLPLGDAVRTSVLSRNWRYKWTTRPELVFHTGSDTNVLPLSRSLMCKITRPELLFHIGSDTDHEDSIGNFIHRILNQHNGPVHKFGLFATNMTMKTSYPDIDQWINFLSRNGVREFTLSFKEGNSSYKIHPSLFSCANLRQLILQCCAIPSPSPTFKGFNDLTWLYLDKVSVNNDEGLRNLIAKCPKLTTLFLLSVAGLDGLNIDYAPNLVSLIFLGSLNYISLNNTPHLVKAIILFTKLPDMNDNIWNWRDTSLINFNYNLNFLSNLRVFKAELNFLKFLAQDHVKKLLPATFENLHTVSFHGQIFEDIDILSLILGLIKSSPNLTKLIIVKASTTTDLTVAEMHKVMTEYLKIESRSIGCFMKLRCVEMENIVGVGPEMELIKLIFSKSPLLEQLIITHDGKVSKLLMMEKHLAI